MKFLITYKFPYWRIYDIYWAFPWVAEILYVIYIQGYVKLSQLYHLLTGKYLNTGDTNYAEQEIDQLITNHYQNLLVIIDDVWKP